MVWTQFMSTKTFYLYFVPLPGPEDVINFGLADLTLKQKETVVLQMGANYIPSVHHPHPVPFPCFRSSTEPGQFADAD